MALMKTSARAGVIKQRYSVRVRKSVDKSHTGRRQEAPSQTCERRIVQVMAVETQPLWLINDQSDGGGGKGSARDNNVKYVKDLFPIQ